MHQVLAAVAVALAAATAIAWVLVALRRHRSPDDYPARHRPPRRYVGIRRRPGDPLAPPPRLDLTTPPPAVGRAAVGVDNQMFPVYRPWPSGMRLIHMRLLGVTQ